MLKKVNAPRCADCGSSNIVLEGQGVWDASVDGIESLPFLTLRARLF